MPGKRIYKKRLPKVNKAVKAYVKKAVHHAPEKKLLDFTFGTYVPETDPITYNIMYQSGIANGASFRDQLIGNRCRLQKLTLRGSVKNDASSMFDMNETSLTRISLIAVQDYATTSNLDSGDIMFNANARVDHAVFDYRKVRVLATKMIKLQPVISNKVQTEPFTLTYDFKGKNIQFIGDGEQLNKENYYLVLHSNTSRGVSTIDNASGVSGYLQCTFTDA